MFAIHLPLCKHMNAFYYSMIQLIQCYYTLHYCALAVFPILYMANCPILVILDGLMNRPFNIMGGVYSIYNNFLSEWQTVQFLVILDSLMNDENRSFNIMGGVYSIQ